MLSRRESRRFLSGFRASRFRHFNAVNLLAGDRWFQSVAVLFEDRGIPYKADEGFPVYTDWARAAHC